MTKSRSENKFMNENLSGELFRSHIKDGLYMRITLDLSEDVNTKSLEEAYRKTIADIPFFGQTLVEDHGMLCYSPHDTDYRIRPLSLPDGEGGFGKDMVYVSSEGNTISTAISHAMSDGYGLSRFTKQLLWHYFCIIDKCKYEPPFQTLDMDGTTDLFRDVIGRAEVCPDRVYNMQPCLMFDEKDEGKTTEFIIEFEKQTFDKLCRNVLKLDDDKYTAYSNQLLPIGKIPCVAICLLMARAIRKVDGRKDTPIGCRFPVNTRPLYDRMDALRNFSQPQAALSTISEEERTGEKTEALIKALIGQLDKTALEYQLSELKQVALGNKKAPDDKVARLFKQTFLVSNMGYLCYEPQMGRIKRAYPAGSGFPCMIYLSSYGNKRLIRISQTFSTDRYYKAFVEEIEREV